MQTNRIDSANLTVDPCSNQDLHLYMGPEQDISGGSMASEFISGNRLPDSLITAFADATGWELGLVGLEIKIMDMSPDWPARKPTANRQKCDVVAKELSKLL